MTKTIRSVLLGISFIVFLVVAPVIVLYAMGYRYDFSRAQQGAVGVLLIDAIPSRAQVGINGVSAGRVPRSIPNLTPGDVSVTVTHDGYAPWQKTIRVEGGQTYELHGVRLFPEDPSKTILASAVEQFVLSPNRALIAVLDTRGILRVITSDGDAAARSISLARHPLSMAWSPNSSQLLLEYANGIYEYVQVQEANVHAQRLVTPASVQEAVWDPRLPGRLLMHTQSKELLAVSVQTGEYIVLARDILAFAPTPKELFMVTADGFVGRYDLQGNMLETFELTSDGAHVSRLLAAPQGALAVQLDTGALLVLDERGVFQNVYPSPMNAAWSPAGDMLFVQTTPHELYVYNHANERLRHMSLGALHQIVRLSGTIVNPQWFAGSNHLVYQVNDEIIVAEIDTRDRSQSVTIDTTNTGSADIQVGEDGDELFYLSRSSEDGIISLVRADLTIAY